MRDGPAPAANEKAAVRVGAQRGDRVDRLRSGRGQRPRSASAAAGDRRPSARPDRRAVATHRPGDPSRSGAGAATALAAPALARTIDAAGARGKGARLIGEPSRVASPCARCRRRRARARAARRCRRAAQSSMRVASQALAARAAAERRCHAAVAEPAQLDRSPPGTPEPASATVHAHGARVARIVRLEHRGGRLVVEAQAARRRSRAPGRGCRRRPPATRAQPLAGLGTRRRTRGQLVAVRGARRRSSPPRAGTAGSGRARSVPTCPGGFDQRRSKRLAERQPSPAVDRDALRLGRDRVVDLDRLADLRDVAGGVDRLHVDAMRAVREASPCRARGRPARRRRTGADA